MATHSFTFTWFFIGRFALWFFRQFSDVTIMTAESLKCEAIGGSRGLKRSFLSCFPPHQKGQMGIAKCLFCHPGQLNPHRDSKRPSNAGDNVTSSALGMPDDLQNSRPGKTAWPGEPSGITTRINFPGNNNENATIPDFPQLGNSTGNSDSDYPGIKWRINSG